MIRFVAVDLILLALNCDTKEDKQKFLEFFKELSIELKRG
jgi:hypothetical protein